jgi:hypothetical protein
MRTLGTEVSAHQYSALCSFSCLESSLTPTGLNMPVGSIVARGSHVPHRRPTRARATFMPDTAWPGPQAPARLIPGQDPGPGFDAVRTLSALQQWFTRVRLFGSHLTHHVRLFRSAHHPGSLTGAACGGFGPPPARAVPEGPPPSPVQHHNQRHDLLHRNLQLCSWRTDLRVLGAIGAGQQGEPAEQAQHRQIGES